MAENNDGMSCGCSLALLAAWIVGGALAIYVLVRFVKWAWEN